MADWPKDLDGWPVPKVMTLGQVLAWALARRSRTSAAAAAMRDRHPEHEAAAKSREQVSLILGHIGAGTLPIRGRWVTYSGPVLREIARVDEHYRPIEPEMLLGRTVQVGESAVVLEGTVEWAHVIADRGDVLRLWPVQSARAEQAKTQTRRRCREWLIEQMQASPGHRPRTKESYQEDALAEFPGLTQNAFNEEWRAALAEAGTAEAWSRAGRPKIPRKNPQDKF